MSMPMDGIIKSVKWKKKSKAKTKAKEEYAEAENQEKLEQLLLFLVQKCTQKDLLNSSTVIF